MAAICFIWEESEPATAKTGEDQRPGGPRHDVTFGIGSDAETVIGPANVGELTLDWTFDAADNGGTLPFQSTPVIADGCVYVASGNTSGGGVFAINADTGDGVWTNRVDGGILGLTVQDGRVYAGSYTTSFDLRAQALDQATGAEVWRTERLTLEGRRQDGEVIHASPVVFDGMYFVAVSRGVGPDARPPLTFLDAATGAVLKRVVVVSEDDHALGYSGAGAWSTAAVDTVNKVIYVATADSEAFKTDHAYNNAILKIDADKTSSTFGTVLGSYKGEGEHYLDGLNLYDQPACEMFGDDRTGTSPSSSLTCAELDLDFGASVNLFSGEGGRTVVGAMQKSGVYHAVYGDTMERAWRVPLSAPSAAGNAGTSAVDAAGVYVSANPSVIASLDRSTGSAQWISSSMHDAIRYQPMTVANGVVYTVTTTGVLIAFDAANGLPLWQRAMGADIGGPCTTQGGGVAVARNTVFAQCDDAGIVLAYRLT